MQIFKSMDFLVSVPPSADGGQWGMIIYASEPKYGQLKTQIVIPQLTPFVSLRQPMERLWSF